MEGIGQLQVFLARDTKNKQTTKKFQNEQKKLKKKKNLKHFFLLPSVISTPGSQLSDKAALLLFCSVLLRQVSPSQAGLELHIAEVDFKLLTLLPPPASYSAGILVCAAVPRL